LLQRIVEEAPDYFAAWSMLGQLNRSENKPWIALSCFTRAAMLNARDEATLNNLAECYHSLGASELAEQTSYLALENNPNSVAIHIRLGQLHDERCEYEGACDSYRRAIEIDPMNGEAHFALGISLDELGHSEEPMKSLVKALNLETANSPQSSVIPGILYSISKNPSLSSQVNLIDRINEYEARFRSEACPYPVHFLFAKSGALEATGEFDKSWTLLLDANRIVWNEVHQAWNAGRRRMEMATTSANALPEIANPGPSSRDGTSTLFIVGASRSGKTTFENLIDGSKGLKRGYESMIVEDCVTQTLQHANLPTFRGSWYLPESLYEKFGVAFNEEVRRRGQRARLLTVTNPESIYLAGTFARLVENSFFVFLKRDRFDNTLRCLQKKYDIGHYYSYDPGECSKYIDWNNSMADLWARKIGRRAFVIEYDELIESSDRQLDRLSDMIEIDLTSDGSSLGDDRGCARPYMSYLGKII
jgi:tetratricopeptide (TPR) repeat protein